ncbi:hypothetical protein ABEV74_11070 [Paenibacillus cisolokensis]|uniref:hypothetical protein n=1 Tax=Paenibacillus cisolokensis TaxID=1658519 RepID=UPI003D26ACF9
MQKELTTDAHFLAAILAEKKVIVTYRDTGQIADYGGPIQQATAHAVKINDMHYMRHACHFYVRR